MLCSRPVPLRRCLLVIGAMVLVGCSVAPKTLTPNFDDEDVNRLQVRGALAEGIDGLAVGHRLMEAGEYELALDAYYAAALDQGLNVDTLSAIGSANLRLGRLGQAEKILRRALDEDEDFVPAWNNLGIVLHARGELGEAREAFRVAFALDSGASDEIRENFQRVDAELQNVVSDTPPPTDFRLVRRGNGRYLLLGN